MFPPFRICAAALSLALALANSAAHAEVKLPAIISTNMALQQGIPVVIWGWAAPQEHIAVTFAGHTQTAIAAADGKWDVKLDALAASSDAQEMTIRGSATPNPIVIKNVVVGEVWLCSGQSNMGFALNAAHNAAVEIPQAAHPAIRLFTVARKLSFKPLSDCQGEWVECTPKTAAGFSAVAYFFGRDLQAAMKTPVGLIHSSWGGTPAQAWTSLDVLKADPRMARYIQKYEKVTADVAQPTPDHNQLASVLYNGMIAPILPYTIAGTIWYQGESNAGESDLYADLFADMIRDWRTRWGQGDFPFVFVQLANYQARRDQPTDTGWARLREAQLKTLALPRTGMAVIIDIGQGDNIHPKDKSDVGHRLFLAAEHVAYGKENVYSGPIYRSMTVEGDKVHVKFSQLGSGLMVGRAPSTQPVEAKEAAADDRPMPTQLTGFAIAGVDQRFVWADAKIEGDEVVVSSPQVKDPAAVRYAWGDNPQCDLYNKEGLPGSPFRTDEWGMGK